MSIAKYSVMVGCWCGLALAGRDPFQAQRYCLPARPEMWQVRGIVLSTQLQQAWLKREGERGVCVKPGDVLPSGTWRVTRITRQTVELTANAPQGENTPVRVLHLRREPTAKGSRDEEQRK